jgi:hypothetical protein
MAGHTMIVLFDIPVVLFYFSSHLYHLILFLNILHENSPLNLDS